MAGWRKTMVVATVAFFAVGCGAKTESAAPSGAPSTVTVTQVNGVTEFPAGAKRFVAVGNSIDNLLALGIKPVAVVETAMPLPTPWQGDKLAGVPVIRAADKMTVPTEEVAKYRPDVIVGPAYTMNAETTKRLSPVAKVLGGIAADGSSMNWVPQLTALARIAGREPEGDRVLADDKATFEAERNKYPDLRDKSAVVAQYIAAGGNFNLVSEPKDPANLIFSDLGMRVPSAVSSNPEYRKSFQEAGGRAPVSLELLPTIGSNFMAIYPAGANAADLDRLPGYLGLPQVVGGTTLVCDIATVMAMNQPSSLSRAWILTQLRPFFDKVQKQPIVR